MITRDYCVTMARYNAWQNREMARAMQTLPDADLTRDRGAFFGTILGTCNHLLWGDRIWMSRFTDTVEAPSGRPSESTTLTPTAAVWHAERFRLDGLMIQWAEKLHSIDIAGTMRWMSGAAGGMVERPIGELIVHMFNHQTHHRGQIHAMLTAAGAKTSDTDLFLMPRDDRDL